MRRRAFLQAARSSTQSAAAAARNRLAPAPATPLLTFKYWTSACGLVGFMYTPPVRWAACGQGPQEGVP